VFGSKGFAVERGLEVERADLINDLEESRGEAEAMKPSFIQHVHTAAF